MLLLGSPDVRVRTRGSARVVEVRGDLDLLGAPAVRDALARAVDDGDGAVVVDLRRATLLSAAMMHTLLNAVRRLTRRGRRLVVVGGPEIERVFRLARLDGTLPVVPDVRAALDAARPRAAA